MESIKFQTAHEYDKVNRVHVFHMRMPIGNDMLYTTVKMAEEHLYHGKEHAMEMVKYELAHGLTDEIRKQAEQFLAPVDLLSPPKPKPSNHATGPAADLAVNLYQNQIGSIWGMPLPPMSAQDLEELKAKFTGAIKTEPTYKEKAISEFEGVEGLDESLWKDGTDGLT